MITGALGQLSSASRPSAGWGWPKFSGGSNPDVGCNPRRTSHAIDENSFLHTLPKYGKT